MPVKSRIMVKQICLQNKSQGCGNVRSKRESGLGTVPIKRIMVSGMCFQKGSQGHGNVLLENESGSGECEFYKVASLRLKT